MSDRIAVFAEGRIEQVGTPTDIYEQPDDAVRRGIRRHLESSRRRDRGRAGRPARHSARFGPSTCASSTPPTAIRRDDAATRARFAVPRRGRAHTRRRPRVAWASLSMFRAVSPAAQLAAGRALHRRMAREPMFAQLWNDRHRRSGETMRHMHRQLVCGAALLALLVAGCGSSSKSSSSGSTNTTVPQGQASIGAGERRGLDPRVARLRRGRQQRPEGRLGHAVREGDGLQGNGEVLRYLRRGIQPLQDRRVRRRVELGRRDTAHGRRRRRGADQHERCSPTGTTSTRCSRRSRGTRSTASSTAFRTAGARTCSCTTRTW